MKYAVGLSLALALSAAAVAADPVPWSDSIPGSNLTGEPLQKVDAQPPARKRLDLRVGKIQDLMLPRDLDAMMKAPDFERDAVVVEAQRELLEMKFEKPIPSGFPPATLWWAVRNPMQSWRIFLPDMNAPEIGPTVDKVPPREFRWGP